MCHPPALRYPSLMSDPVVSHEEATVRAFLVGERRERFLELLPNPKHRQKITKLLAHPNPAWFESRWVKPIPPKESSAEGIEKLLRAKGAGRMCWVISEDKRFDGRECELDSVLGELVGYGMGTILSCVPGKLAFVESEDGRFVLEK
jgi:hypothetical protein